MKLDDTDRAILAALRENGRATNSEIAGRLDVSEGTVRNRIGKLTGSGFLSVEGLVDPNQDREHQLVCPAALGIPLVRGLR